MVPASDLELILDLLPVMIGFVDANLRFVWVNKAYADWYRLPGAAFSGRPVQEVVAPESWEKAAPLMKEALAGRRVDYENVAISENGEVRAVSVTYLPVPGQSGDIRGFIGLVQDTTTLKKVEIQRDQGEKELSVAHAELRILRGLLPICSHCKKIRDSHSSWQTLETYIRNHSEADFSHGICPECLKKFYPDV